MNRTERVVRLQEGSGGGGGAVTVTRTQLLEAVAQAYEHHGQQMFQAIPDIHGSNISTCLTLSTTDTILGPAVEALNRAGISVDPTVGGVQKVLGLSDAELHDIACACHGQQVAGTYMAKRFRDLNTSAD